jgi:hypothetical protein
MPYVNVVRSSGSPCASIQIQAPTLCALPFEYRRQLHQLLQPYTIPMPGSDAEALGDASGEPLCALVNAQIADLLGAEAENLIQQALRGH